MRSLGSINPDTMVSCFFPYSKINRRGHKAENISRNRSFEEEVYVGGRERDGGKIGYEERSITQPPPFLFFLDDSWFGCLLEILSCLLLSSNGIGSTSQHVSEQGVDLNSALLLKKASFLSSRGASFLLSPPFVKPPH